MAESKEKPATTEVPVKPQPVMVNAKTAEGRLLLFSANLDKCLEMSAYCKSDQEVQDIVTVMKEQAKDNAPMLVMCNTGSPDLTWEVEVYELNDKFWVWFNAMAARARKIKIATDACEQVMLELLEPTVHHKDVPPKEDEYKRAAWFVNKLDDLDVIVNASINFDGNADIREELSGFISDNRLACVVLKQFIADLEEEASKAQKEAIEKDVSAELWKYSADK